MKVHKRLYLVSIFQNLGERVMFTFASLWADSNGATPAETGLMLSLQNIIGFAGQSYFGRLSDVVGRVTILVFGFFLSALTSYLILKTSSPILIILVFCFYNIGFSAVQPSWNALIGDAYPDSRAVALGKLGSIATLFGGTLYLVMGILSEREENAWYFIFTIAAVSFSFAGLVAFLGGMRTKQKMPDPNKQRGSIFEPMKYPKFRKFVLRDATFALAMSTTWPLFPRATNNLATPFQVTVIWFFAFTGFAITARVNKKIKDKIGSYRWTFFASRFTLFLVPVVFAFATSWLHLLAVRIMAGATFGLYSITQKDYILETARTQDRIEDNGWYLGTHAFIWGVFTFVGSLLFGLVSDFLLNLEVMDFAGLFLVTSLFRMLASFGFLQVPEPEKDILLQ